MSEQRQFDVIVLGAGPAGEVCAGRLADGELDVAGQVPGTSGSGRDPRASRRAALRRRAVSARVFTEPQVAAVGHTLASARSAGLSVSAVDESLGANAGETFIGHGAPGGARLVIDHERGVIAGATLVGVEVAESLHAATVAVIGEVPLERLVHAVPAFPTRSEVWLGLLAKALA